MLMDDIPPYRKKRSQKSKASKHSDHKHVYMTCLLRSKYSGYLTLGQRCTICGRSIMDWYSCLGLHQEEIKEKYKHLPIYDER